MIQFSLFRCCKIHDACYEAISNHPNLCPFESSVYWKIYSRDDTCTGCSKFCFCSKVICGLSIIIYDVVNTRSRNYPLYCDLAMTYDLLSPKPLRGSPMGFFNPVILTQNFVQSRNPEGYLGHSNSRAYFRSQILPYFASKSRIPSFK